MFYAWDGTKKTLVQQKGPMPQAETLKSLQEAKQEALHIPFLK